MYTIATKDYSAVADHFRDILTPVLDKPFNQVIPDNVIESSIRWLQDNYHAIDPYHHQALAQGLWNGFVNTETTRDPYVQAFIDAWT